MTWKDIGYVSTCVGHRRNLSDRSVACHGQGCEDLPVVVRSKLTIFSSFQGKSILSFSTTISNICVGCEEEADMMIC